MFERPHHRDLALVLQSLDPGVLSGRRCFFGGGTAMALLYGEYRESVDIDFLVSDRAGYRELRQMLGGVHGLDPLLRSGLRLELAREVRTDQYGIRTHVRAGASLIKFEIVFEARGRHLFTAARAARAGTAPPPRRAALPRSLIPRGPRSCGRP